MNALAAAAVRYAELGFYVHPLKPGTKVPRTKNGVLDATNDIEQIKAWWRRDPNCNIGIAVGRHTSGRSWFAVDLDEHAADQSGNDAWAEMVSEHGDVETVEAMTATSGTGGRGRHLWFWSDGEVIGSDRGANFPAGIDLKGLGGYVVAPPSIITPGGKHVGGNYEWEAICDLLDGTQLADAPPWLMEILLREAPRAIPRRDGKAHDEIFGGTTMAKERPGDYWALRANWYDLIAGDGAEYIGTKTHFKTGTTYEVWARPGCMAEYGELHIGMTLYFVDSDVLKVHTDAHPLLGAAAKGETFTKFGYLAATRFGGNFEKASAWCREQLDLEHVRNVAATVERSKSSTTPTTPTATMTAEAPTITATVEAHDDAPIAFSHTDLGNARRLCHSHGEDIRFAPQLGAWFVWDRTHWAEDIIGVVHRRAKDVVDAMATEMFEIPDDRANERKALNKHWERSQSAGSLSAMVRLAETEPAVPVLLHELDRDPWLLNVGNGTIDLRTGEFRSHERRDLMTKCAPVSYDVGATCPTWLRFVDWAMGGDEELVRFVQAAVGYSLTGLTSEQVLFFLYGHGENGKSTFLNAIESVFGEYGVAAESDLLLAVDGERHSTGLTDLVGRRFVVCQELDEGRRLAEATVKQLTGGDLIRARRMRQDFFEFRPVAKFWIAANHKPAIRGTDHAIWRRFKLIPFLASLDPAERDPKLGEKLAAEAPGILNWALEGLAAWRGNGDRLPKCSAVDDATANYRHDQDHVGRFIDEVCVVTEGQFCSARELRMAYEKWCEEMGERPWTQKSLGSRLGERGFERVVRGRLKAWTWVGIGVASEFSGMITEQYIAEHLGRTNDQPVAEAAPSTPEVDIARLDEAW